MWGWGSQLEKGVSLPEETCLSNLDTSSASTGASNDQIMEQEIGLVNKYDKIDDNKVINCYSYLDLLLYFSTVCLTVVYGDGISNLVRHDYCL